jgi:methylenetetrahydrofolate reductase (NADPH)
LLKLEKKVQCGAKFIIAQIGFDARKSHEMLCYMKQRGMARVPLIGNVFLLTPAVMRFFRKRTIPGVVISDALFDECERHANDPPWFKQLAAKQLAIFRGLGCSGAYLGGVHRIEDVDEILDIESRFAAGDWKQFARDIQYPVQDEFYYYAKDEATGLADASRVTPRSRKPTRNVTLKYHFTKWVHDAVFTPGKPLNRLGKWIYSRSRDTYQGPRSLRVLEHASKAAMFKCKDCGDCSLPDIAFLCPESACAKNQRNGPCGGTRDGLCEVADFECIWSRAYDRMKYEGRDGMLLEHAPVIQDQSLRGTSSWANALLCRDHTATSCTPSKQLTENEPKPDAISSTNPQPDANHIEKPQSASV